GIARVAVTINRPAVLTACVGRHSAFAFQRRPIIHSAKDLSQFGREGCLESESVTFHRHMPLRQETPGGVSCFGPHCEIRYWGSKRAGINVLLLFSSLTRRSSPGTLRSRNPPRATKEFHPGPRGREYLLPAMAHCTG